MSSADGFAEISRRCSEILAAIDRVLRVPEPPRPPVRDVEKVQQPRRRRLPRVVERSKK
jgi:hypothetical protein